MTRPITTPVHDHADELDEEDDDEPDDKDESDGLEGEVLVLQVDDVVVRVPLHVQQRRVHRPTDPQDVLVVLRSRLGS